MSSLQETKERLYTPKETAEIIEIDKETLRKWSEHFNIQTERTKEDGTGHRRYSKKNIEELTAIKEKIRNQNWSWDQVLQWRNGEEDMFLTHQEKSNLEKKIDKLLEDNKLQQDFNKKIVETMAAAEMRHQTELNELKKYIAESVERRDQLLLENIRKTQQQKKRKKFLGIF